MRTISLLGCSTSVALATGPTDEEEEECQIKVEEKNKASVKMWNRQTRLNTEN